MQNRDTHTPFPGRMDLDFRALFESAPGLYLVLTPDFEIVAASNAYLQATMTRREDILGCGIFDVFPDNPDDPEATGVRNLRASLTRVVENRVPDAMPIQKYDVRRPETDGGGFEPRYWSPLNAPVLDSRGQVAYIIHRVEDVTEFVALKEASRRHDERAQALETRAEQMEAEVYLRARQISDANRQLRSANDELNRLYRGTAALMAQADQELGVPGSADDPPAGQDVPPERMLERVGHLISRHLQLGEQLRQAQKMEAIGRLAGGIAHDFNNLLTGIAGNVDFLADRFPTNDSPVELQEIMNAVERAAALTSQLLAFSRKQVVQPRVLDLNSVISGMENLLRRLIGEDIQLVFVLGRCLGRIKADAGQMEQVILNLAVNARDAMPDGGRLVIETGEADVADGQVPSLKPGRYVTLMVTDTGHGMDEETRRRVFEPFFTTKAVGKGTGLGLATAYGIAEQNGGAMTVQSAKGQGAVFRMYLPQTLEPAHADSAVPAPPRQARTGCCLVVEDEPFLRQLISRALVGAGYRVVEAAGGQEALAKVRQSPCPLDLVLTDVVMPGMSGPELIGLLREKYPAVPVLYMSGYDFDLMGRASRDPNAAFLPKPFTPKVLLNRVAELLPADKPDSRAG